MGGGGVVEGEEKRRIEGGYVGGDMRGGRGAVWGGGGERADMNLSARIGEGER
jgi:hypothetical protein